jgi:hypothetical protein
MLAESGCPVTTNAHSFGGKKRKKERKEEKTREKENIYDTPAC